MVKASEKKHANIMLYIKFPWAYTLTRKSAETDWSRYETATVREKASQCGGSWHCDIESYTANIKDPIDSNAQKTLDKANPPVRQRGWVNCTCPTIGLDFWKRETWSVRPADAFLPKVWVSWRVGEPQSRVKGGIWLFQDFQYFKMFEVIFFFKWMFNSKNILRKKGG